ncbi:MACPF domain-containing protein [Nymphaea thermarum]|nr:MACPF domain-containing protein [Nymphaea thermarum]
MTSELFNKGLVLWLRISVPTLLCFLQMSEHFNQWLSFSGKIPSGLFNAMFGLHGCWQKDASTAKSLAYDGWFITLYNVELNRSHIGLQKHVEREVPSAWYPAALASMRNKMGGS